MSYLIWLAGSLLIILLAASAAWGDLVAPTLGECQAFCAGVVQHINEVINQIPI